MTRFNKYILYIEKGKQKRPEPMTKGQIYAC